MGGENSTHFKALRRRHTFDSRLMRAIARYDLKTIQYLLQKDPSALDKVEAGLTPLNLAIYKRNKDITRLLIDKGCCVNLVDSSQAITPLCQATADLSQDTIQLLVDRGADVNLASPEDGNTPLCLLVLSSRHAQVTASEREDLAKLEMTRAIISYLVSHGGDVNLGDQSNNTPIHLSAMYNCISLLRCFLRVPGCDLNLQNGPQKKDRTPLHLAIEHGHYDAVRELVSHGCDVNLCEAEHGHTPLTLAASKERLDMMRLILASPAGIHINATTKQGTNILHEVLHHFRRYPENAKAIMPILIHQGANVNHQEELMGQTPLHIAAKQGNVSCCQLLLEKGARPDLCTWQGKSPLYWAASMGKQSVIETLLDMGADINQTDALNKSPLHAAVYQGHSTAVALLLSKHAQVNAVDSNGKSSLYLASKHGRYEIAEQLIKAGANPDVYDDEDKGPLHMAILFPKLDFPMIQLLLDGGCDPVNLQDFLRWIQFHGIVRETEILASELCDWYLYLMSRPPMLKHLCRITLRERLKILNPSADFKALVATLPLPTLLKNYLKVKML